MYSQHDEEFFLLKKLPPTGRFLDIGAWWPRELSNTRALYERGWSGLMIEPSPGPMQKLIQEYGYDSRVTLLQSLIGTERSVIQMEVTDDAVSTVNADVRELWARDGKYYGRCYVPQLTFADIANQFGAFDFIDIDIEGGSMDVFDRVLSSKMLPMCICVEHDSQVIQAERMAHKWGYYTGLVNETNLIFLR